MKEIFLELYKKKQIVNSYERETSSDVSTTPLFACYPRSIALEMLQNKLATHNASPQAEY